MNPSLYNLPHPAFRPHQAETIQWCSNIDGVGITEAPTGSGKTCYPAAVATQKTVIALVKTKNLQVTNYGNTYGFDVLFGKRNYKCVHPDAVPGSTGSECLHDDNMYGCKHSRHCPYLIQKGIVKASSKASLNYAYWLTARWPRQEPPQVLFLDEAHELHHITTEFAGCTVTEKQRVEWELPTFPKVEHLSANVLLRLPEPIDAAIPWLEAAIGKIQYQYSNLKRQVERDERKRKQFQKCEQLGRKLRSTLEALRMCPDDWYVRSGRLGQRFGYEWRPAFVCKPLTAKHHFPSYFLDGHNTVAMSATIGNLAAFTGELGIQEYDSLVVPNQYPPETRPIHLLDCPSMGSKASKQDFEKQADEIADAIKGCPNEWSGLVLVTRKSEAKLLADRLARRGLQDRVWVTPGWDGSYEPTDKQAKAWERRKKRVSNSLCVTWSMWLGFDGLDEKILIAAKAPYPVWGSNGSYEAAWRSYSSRRYRWQTGCTLAQGLGRTRRGRPEDYDLDGMTGFVAVADGSVSRVKSAMPQAIQDAIVR